MFANLTLWKWHIPIVVDMSNASSKLPNMYYPEKAEYMQYRSEWPIPNKNVMEIALSKLPNMYAQRQRTKQKQLKRSGGHPCMQREMSNASTMNSPLLTWTAASVNKKSGLRTLRWYHTYRLRNPWEACWCCARALWGWTDHQSSRSHLHKTKLTIADSQKNFARAKPARKIDSARSAAISDNMALVDIWVRIFTIFVVRDLQNDWVHDKSEMLQTAKKRDPHSSKEIYLKDMLETASLNKS